MRGEEVRVGGWNDPSADVRFSSHLYAPKREKDLAQTGQPVALLNKLQGCMEGWGKSTGDENGVYESE